MVNLCHIFILFIIYSFIGWIVEVINFLFKEKRFINRGFLIGPYCPIYGVGVLLIINILKRFMDSPLALFILAMVICMLLEYITSYLMEKLFNARWWDYSSLKFNINGRICLETAIPFGIGGFTVMYLVNPFIEGLIGKMSDKLLIIVGIVLFIIFVTDLIMSLLVILKVKTVDVSKCKDDTEAMSKKVREYLMKHSKLTRRLMESFPNAKIHLKRLKNKIMKKGNSKK